ncbi:DUF6221 family protein [Streptomyces klenkii]|uniref:DUF6221 family protein n=1 Tax=Streptomyces klenkii TaxID=1420899 RepID=UPI0036EBA100
MVTETDQIIAFVLARLDEAAETQRDQFDAWHGKDCESIYRDAETPTFPCDCGVPERVLAEIDAKRALLEDLDYGGAEMGDAQWLVARRLASLHADHPDYQERWRH